ncbi:hypothetical protein WR164_12460 [Philodulcilactobacillus myokoensis]|uniref:Uncharacterized protein n=1 Tax=Philodulcilactobacillus myokoensis TaxID=2929573 RepID=A0A9W6B1L7_9LACO|nr:hypothetical protein [Philodulcilactobacillus myokoensis]GLB47267.1 hypothetical protein WR164_12460 [Philodulcilactobacillus myokoensis]
MQRGSSESDPLGSMPQIVTPKFSINFKMMLFCHTLSINDHGFIMDTGANDHEHGQRLLDKYTSMFPKRKSKEFKDGEFERYILSIQDKICQLEYLRGEGYFEDVLDIREMNQKYKNWIKYYHILSNRSDAEIKKDNRDYDRVKKQLDSLSPFEQRRLEEDTKNQGLDVSKDELDNLF